MKRTMLSYAEAYAAGPATAGGKGWNLSRLDRYGFGVPPGGVISAEVYHAINARPSMSRLVHELARVPAEEADSEPVRRQLAAIREAFQHEPLPEPTIAQLDEFLNREGLQAAPVAIRSSATVEDGAIASFAGIHESVLNATGLEAILGAVRRCYGSLWSPRALSYRRHWGIADADCGCAVLVCRMVESVDRGPPRAAGVVFSCDPRTGRRDLVIINAAPGLGDALVRGSVTPQQFVVRPSGMRWSIVERPDASTWPRPALTDEQVHELAVLALRGQCALGDGQDPQDIEWAHDGERFWLVQARPVTHRPRWTFPSIAGQPVHWSNANVKEVLPGVVSTLTWSLVEEAVSRTLYTVQEAVGYDVPPGMEVLRRFSGRGYFDLTAMQWAFFDSLGSPPADLNRDLGGAQPEIEVPPGHPFRGGPGRRRLGARLKFMARLVRLNREIGPKMARLMDEARAMRGFDPERCSPAELHREWLRWEQTIWEFCPLFQLAGGYCAAWLMILRSLGTRLDPQRGNSLALRLLAGTGQVTSAEHGYRVWELAKVARRDAQALTWLDTHRTAEVDTPDPQAWNTLPPSSPFRQALEQFLHDYGHRSTLEVELAHPRWIEDVSFVLAQVRAALDDEAELSDPREAAARVRAEAEADLRRATWLFRSLAFWVVRRARRGMALREASKSAAVAAMEPQRRLALELGRRLAAAGHLDAVDDVFHLAGRDLEAYLLGHWDGRGARALAADRRTQQLAWQGQSPLDVITWPADAQAPATRQPPQAADGVVNPAATEAAARWRGVPAAAGRGTGPACVLHSPLESPRLRRGDVLVAPSTDPSWAPLFLRAAAVVMETGGYLSHGAIVARELGLPAVVNLPGILRHIADGDRLVVDGDIGEVIRLAESD